MPGKKLLVADDSLTIQKVIRLALSNEGYEIQAVSDGADAVQQVSLFRPDAVLIDVSLPGKTAFEVKREINQHDDLSEVRFVLMSSAFETVDEKQADEVVFHGRLTKPFDPAHLRKVLVDVLSQVSAKRMEKTSILNPSEPSFEIPPVPEYEDLHEMDGIDLPEAEEPPESVEDSVKPDLPTLPPSNLEKVNELWEPETLSAGPTLPPRPLETERDIHELTQSTIKMSNMEDFGWKVSEPTLKPLPNMIDQGGSTFEVKLHPLPTEEPDFSSQMPSDLPSELPPIPTFSAAESPERKLPEFPIALEKPKMEELIRAEVQKHLEKVIQNFLPDVAEKIIKQEIHRLLSE